MKGVGSVVGRLRSAVKDLCCLSSNFCWSKRSVQTLERAAVIFTSACTSALRQNNNSMSSLTFREVHVYEFNPSCLLIKTRLNLTVDIYVGKFRLY